MSTTLDPKGQPPKEQADLATGFPSGPSHLGRSSPVPGLVPGRVPTAVMDGR